MQIDDTYLTSLLTDLVNINSVFPDELKVMLRLERELQGLGLRPQRIPIAENRFNLLSRVGSGSPVLCLNAHADTVPPSGKSVPQAEIRGDILHGLGSADDKGSLVAMIGAIKAILESQTNLKGTLDLLISVDEEGGATGVRTAIQEGYRCDMAITGEPTSLQIVPTHCGLVFLDIITLGKATHGSIPFEGENAIDRMYELVAGLRRLVTDFPTHPTVGPPSMNLGILRGGDRPNRVPDRCEASVDIRLVPPTTVDQVLERIEAYFAGLTDYAEYTITKKGSTLDTPGDSRLMTQLGESAESVVGSRPQIRQWRGWTEAESFQTGLGIDAVVFGPGALKEAHSSNEFVLLTEVHQAARVYAQAAVSILASNS